MVMSNEEGTKMRKGYFHSWVLIHRVLLVQNFRFQRINDDLCSEKITGKPLFARFYRPHSWTLNLCVPVHELVRWPERMGCMRMHVCKKVPEDFYISQTIFRPGVLEIKFLNSRHTDWQRCNECMNRIVSCIVECRTSPPHEEIFTWHIMMSVINNERNEKKIEKIFSKE